MILLLDVGNTRLKWAWLDAEQMSAPRAVLHHGAPAAWAEELEEWLSTLQSEGRSPDRIVVANVAGGTFARLLGGWSKAHFGLWPEFVTSKPYACGITNGYLRPDVLGVDRWLGMIGAWSMAPDKPACVINAGTAVTLDVLTHDGMHLGGFILPGMQLMQEALYGRTGNVAALAEAEPARVEGLFGVNTAGAIEEGIALSLASLGERALEELLRRDGHVPHVLLTGGDAARLQPRLKAPARVVPDLVLVGLSLLARESAP
jgi:type III pantothenate kinase